jgi:ATP-dependent Clp protease ATP-binding subunit ClpA
MFKRRRSNSMYERFTERARKVVVLAQEEARHFNHNYIGTEHLLLGLLREDEGVAARALAALDVTVDEVREQVESIVGYGEEGMGAQAPFTPRSKKVLELALRESMQLGHNYIGSEHILLGLIRESEGVANQIFSNMGVEADEVRREVVRMLGGEPGQRLESASRDVEPPESARNLLLFRGRVESLQIDARFGDQPRTLLVDLDYTYAVRDTEDASRAVNHEDLLTGVAKILEAQEFRSIETGIWRVGEHVLENFPAVTEITVSVTEQRMLEAHAISGFTVARTFRR